MRREAVSTGRALSILFLALISRTGLATEIEGGSPRISTPESCPDFRVSGEGSSGAYRMWSEKRGACTARFNSGDLRRLQEQFSAADTGAVMIFASDPTIEKLSQGTSSRVQIFFPRGAPATVVESGSEFILGLPDGHSLIFDRKTGAPIRYTGGKIRTEEPGTLGNAGGVSLESEKGVTVDCGVKRGESPLLESARECTVLSQGKSCKVTVSTLVASADLGTLKGTDSELADVLSGKCPGMDFSIMKEATLARRIRALESLDWEEVVVPKRPEEASPEVQMGNVPPKPSIPGEEILPVEPEAERIPPSGESGGRSAQ